MGACIKEIQQQLLVIAVYSGGIRMCTVVLQYNTAVHTNKVEASYEIHVILFMPNIIINTQHVIQPCLQKISLIILFIIVHSNLGLYQ